MTNLVEQTLRKIFERHRIVFWYDRDQDLRDKYEKLDIAGIEKIELRNNEFSVKYRILREEPKKKFLVYHEGPAPQAEHNWLLDVELSQGEFRTDKIGLWLTEMGLDLTRAGIIEEFRSFFSKKDNRDAFKNKVDKNDSEQRIKLKVLSICCRSDDNLEAILMKLLLELSQRKDSLWKQVEATGLELFFWEQMHRVYSYKSDFPSLKDFVYQLFQDCYAMAIGNDYQLSNDALVFLKRWQDSSRFQSGFEYFSNDIAKITALKNDLANRDLAELTGIDYFKIIDQRILYELVTATKAKTVSLIETRRIIFERRSSYWYEDHFRELYEAVELASQLFQSLNELSFHMNSMASGVRNYITNWFLIDQLYRKYIYKVSKAAEATLMNDLTNQIENHYVNNFLFPLGNHWQTITDQAGEWNAIPFVSQKSFFNQYVSPFIAKGRKICVIISDALRYEIVEELQGRIQQEDRFSASLDAMLSVLPSNTQLGMAALLPGKNLEVIEEKGTISVHLDNYPTSGIVNRQKILQSNQSSSAVALSSDSVLEKGGDELRDLVRGHDMFYIYHDHIDATGHRPTTENKVFIAIEETQEHLIKVIKKLAGNNVSNFILTSDHGFLYQQGKIDESDFYGDDIEGGSVLYIDRRYIIGRDLQPNASLSHFFANELSLGGDLEIQIPKSVNRIRKKGSCIQFVHGGMTLQECVIPVLQINKKRRSDINSVDISILQSSMDTITVGHLPITLYQADPVSDKLQQRELRIGLYSQSGVLISSTEEFVFDFKSEDPREREHMVQLTLASEANEFNNEEVLLKLEEKISNTNQYTLYKAVKYKLRRSFISDFEF